MRFFTKRKILVTVVTLVLAASILLGGSFAWQSISQRVTNEFGDLTGVNPGGRLHDDFNGENKDIYVENFGEEEIFARVKLSEYMEIGSGAGLLSSDPGYADKTAVSLVSGADINDDTTWTVHIPDVTEVFHNYYTWTLGNSTASVFMPTFNLNKDSLAVDVNGTFEGPDGNRLTAEDRYADYIKWVAGETKTADEVYDADDNTVDEGSAAVEGVNITTVTDQTHTAKATGTATVMTMAEWVAAGSPIGSYWVYDTDGWAYWASPIKPGTATGLLLDEVKLTNKPDDDYYYAINATAQFCTETDWFTEQTAGEAPTAAADALFSAILAQRTPDSIMLPESSVSVAAGAAHKFTAKVTVNGHPFDASLVWTVTYEDGTAVTTGTAVTQNGYLTVDSSEQAGAKLKVTVSSSDGTVSDTCVVTVTAA